MKTCCPDCQTTFRVTPEQLKARAGRVRCGQCRKVFNALDSLLDDAAPLLGAEALTASDTPPTGSCPAPSSVPEAAPAPAVAVLLRREEGLAAEDEAPTGETTDAAMGSDDDDDERRSSEERPSPADETANQTANQVSNDSEPVADVPAFGQLQVHHSGHHRIPDPLSASPPLDLPTPTSDRAPTSDPLDDAEPGSLTPETQVPPDHDRWLEGALSEPAPPVASKALTGPFVIVIVLLVLFLVGQIVFHFRGVIALTTPGTRPALAALSAALGSDIPLPRHVDLVSIEASDLQTEPGRNKLLTLQATLRNRASYAQAYPAIELTLTDTADKAIVRRVFLPDDYLTPAQLEAKSFAANADAEVRLWLDASQVNAAGYRLYVFYP